MKQRFSSLDVKVVAKELSAALCTLRLANVYDLSSRIFLLKLAKPNVRHSLVVDSGFKCYLTSFTRTTASAPSHFTSRLRKFLRSKRITAVRQIGTDRIVEIEFSDGLYRLFLEFYAGGNIVLTDRDLSVLALLRTVAESGEQEGLRLGSKYMLETRQNYNGVPPLTQERVRNGIQSFITRDQNASGQQQKQPKRKPGEAVRQAVSAAVPEFSPMLVDSALRSVNFDFSVPPSAILEQDKLFEKVWAALNDAARIDGELSGPEPSGGRIIAKAAKGFSDIAPFRNDISQSVQDGHLKYDEFHPFSPTQFTDSKTSVIITYESFNRAIDEFFSSVESQKLETRLTEKEETARRKLENARQDHEKRIDGLQRVQEANVRKAQAIEANLQRVQEAMTAVNSLLAQGMDWQNIARLIETEQKRQNGVAKLIKLPLKLYENTITLLLDDGSYVDEPDYEGSETESEVSDDDDYDADLNKKKRPSASKGSQSENAQLKIDVDLALSPWSNARQYYDQKRSAAVKEQKTFESSAKALKSAERKIGADLKRGLQQEKDLMRPQRKAVWFEKFIYFISSEGYLVLGGKDAQQNDILYRRYLKKGDVYVHANLKGASSVIIKNKHNKANDPIPPSTLSQAGTLVVSTSSAWDSKAVMSAWWVHAEQVSKTMPNGDLLQPGDFDIKGERNYLPPAQLLLGFAVMFRINEASKARHQKHRIVDTGEINVISEGLTTETELENPRDDVDEDDSRITEENEDQDLEPTNGLTADEEQINNDKDESVDEEAAIDYSNPLQSRDSFPDETFHGAEPEEDHASTQSRADSPERARPGPAPDEMNGGMAIEVSRSAGMNDNSSTIGGETLNELPSSDTPSMAALSEKVQIDETETSSAKLNSKPNDNHPAQIRGKRGKRQKQKNKYAHQDEEDRELAMRLLGSAPAKKELHDASAEKEAKEREAAEQKERRRKQHAKAAERAKQAEEARQREFESGAADEDEGEDDEVAKSLADLDSYVGAPLPGDEILDSLVVCGPWDAIGSRCRWKAKLQPGTVKKGKAVKEILTRWNALATEGDKKKRPGAGAGNETMIEEDKIRRREAELIRGIRDVEVIGTVPVGKVRVVLGAGEKAAGGGKGAAKGGRGGRGSKKK